MNQPKRIIFLDYMRVLALLMMIEGHTTYAFIDQNILNGSSTGIFIWNYVRGYTAPFFMMVSGSVFAYLLINQEKPDGFNPRVKSGLKRIVTLFFWGYMLNFPIYVIWKIFTKDGIDRFLNIRIDDTLYSIVIIGICIFIYNTLRSEDPNEIEEREFINRLLKRKGDKKGVLLKTKLINRKVLRNERIKRRLFSSFFYGFLVSIPFLIISSLLSLNEKIQALRVDVLHVIGFGLLTLVVVYVIFKTNRKLMSVVLFVLMLFFIAIYPLLNNVDLQFMPTYLSAYLNNFNTKSMFTITPWTAYILAGSIMGVWLSYEVKKEHFEKVIGFKLLAIGLLIIFLSEMGVYFETVYYGKSYYWYDSPNLVYHRIGVVVCVGAFMAFLSNYMQHLPKFLKQMSRNTLWLYVGHLIIIYQIVKPAIGYQTSFGIGYVIFFIILMYALMYLQTQIIVKVKENGGYGTVIRKLFTKTKKAGNTSNL